ncbi:MAG: L-threonylcarbamoyladenylate synthase [Endomicrobiia bacterium]
MKIIYLNKNTKNFEKKILSAAKAIKNGNLVIIPTETVYGIAANCFDTSAVNKIFLVKNRPYSDPLIVHVSKISQLKNIVKYIPFEAKKIITKFWPGPVSLIFYKNPKLPDIVTAGLNTVCVRMPENEITRKFIDLCEVPLAAPSANIFSRVSSTDIKHIIKDFKDKKEIKYVIYTGRPKYGIESTVVDCTKYPFEVLRYGVLEIEKITNQCKIKIVEPQKNLIKKSPGMFKKHYAPTKPTYLTKNLISYIEKLPKNKLKNMTFICKNKTKNIIKKIFKNNKISIITYGNNFKDIAKNLYLCLRLAEEMDTEIIVVESVKNVGLGKTIMDRLTKATENKWL